MTRTEHLLVILAEECNEAGQRIHKALRFGLNETQPGQEFTNAERIAQELADLMGVLEMLWKETSIPGLSETGIAAKRQKVEHFLRYSAELGTLQSPRADTSDRRDKEITPEPS